MSSKNELVDNKELKLKGFLEIQNSLSIVLENVNKLKANKNNTDFDVISTSKIALANLVFLIKTLDKKSKSQTVKDLDYLYKHIMFSIIRVRDHSDFDFIDNSSKILTEINEGWDRITEALKKSVAA
tara:strand:- start:197 stop:577 length:381 start_codon:yes stop_codon:yes gene_type:complete